jgi:hypothetical protein
MGRPKGSKNKEKKETKYEKFVREKEDKPKKEDKDYCPGNNLEEENENDFRKEETV